MAHFAQLDENNIVTQVIVADSEEWCNTNLGGKWLQTSYNTYAGQHQLSGEPLRKNYAGIGFTYNEELDAFIPPKVFNSWVLNEETCLWEAPIAIPVEEGKHFAWDEDNQEWYEIIDFQVPPALGDNNG